MNALQTLRPLAPVLKEFALPAATAVETPFSESLRADLAALSPAILRHPRLKRDGAGVALAYWLRPSNLEALKRKFEKKAAAEAPCVFVPAGHTFHVAPSNVETLFLYSWALSFLCGNANVVRVSEKTGETAQALLECLNDWFATKPRAAARNRFVTYAHDAATTATLSAWCSHRVVWGGDETVRVIRSVALPAHASERAFGDKFSYAAISAKKYAAASPAVKDRLAAGFFNDFFWFGQLACSSPQLVFWVGTPGEAAKAAEAFEVRLEAQVRAKKPAASPDRSLERLLFAFELAAGGEADVRLRDGFVGASLETPPTARTACGGGLLRNVRTASLADVASFAGPKDQTVAHFGFTAKEIGVFARAAGARGVDRVVPVGEALAFDADWDGFDLVSDFLRKVTVR